MFVLFVVAAAARGAKAATPPSTSGNECLSRGTEFIRLWFRDAFEATLGSSRRRVTYSTGLGNEVVPRVASSPGLR